MTRKCSTLVSVPRLTFPIQHASYEGPGESDDEQVMPSVDDEQDENEDEDEGKKLT